MSAAGDRAGRVLLDAQHAGRIAVVLHDQRLDVEHDVGDVLEHALDRGEFVLGVVDLDLRDGAAFQAGKQNAAQAVADRRAEAALERLGDELAVGRASGSPRRKSLRWAAPSPRHRICMRSLLENGCCATMLDVGDRCRRSSACEHRNMRSISIDLSRAKLDDQLGLDRNRNVVGRGQAADDALPESATVAARQKIGNVAARLRPARRGPDRGSWPGSSRGSRRRREPGSWGCRRGGR